jgi:hypothetical protein
MDSELVAWKRRSEGERHSGRVRYEVKYETVSGVS